MQAKLPETSERFIICLANNNPSTQIRVHRLSEEIKSQSAFKPWQWCFLDREKTLYPVENWYSAIISLADENEVVFLNGDDDLFLLWSLVDRYKAITKSGADMLLSKSESGLIFLRDKRSVYYQGSMPARREKLDVHEIGWSDIAKWGSAFIGNHCYRYTEQFRKALNLCFEWCHEQDWLDWNTRTLMLPYYLPFAVKHVGGKLVGIEQKYVIRGTVLAQTLKAPFGVPGWNSGFLSLCGYGVLTNKDLGSNVELESARLELARMASDWFCTFFFDKRIPNQIVKETLRRIQLPNFSLCSLSFLRSCLKVFQEKSGLKLVRARICNKIPNKRVKSISTFLEFLKTFHCSYV